MQAEQLTEMWTMAMQLGPEGKEAALQAALTFISRAAPPVATVFTGNFVAMTPNQAGCLTPIKLCCKCPACV